MSEFNKLARLALKYARGSRQTYFVVTNGKMQIVCADGFVIDPEKITIEFCAFPTSNEKQLIAEGII